MEPEKLLALANAQSSIKKLKEHRQLFEGGKIKSVIVHKLDTTTLEYKDIEVPVAPRGKVKALLINHLNEDIKHYEEKIAAL